MTLLWIVVAIVGVLFAAELVGVLRDLKRNPARRR